MKYSFLLATLILFATAANCQLDKKIWLVGGSGSFKSFNSNYTSVIANAENQVTQIKITPNIGYFIMDKLVFGLKSTLEIRNEKGLVGGSGGIGKSLRFDYGPFVRYYFLDKEKRFNFLSDLSYQVGNVTLTGEKGKRSNFSILAGPSIFFNSSVAMEFLLGYIYTMEQISSPTFGNPYKQIDKGFQFAIGFQIHLEKL
jgi:hypothetical protein